MRWSLLVLNNIVFGLNWTVNFVETSNTREYSSLPDILVHSKSKKSVVSRFAHERNNIFIRRRAWNRRFRLDDFPHAQIRPPSAGRDWLLIELRRVDTRDCYPSLVCVYVCACMCVCVRPFRTHTERTTNDPRLKQRMEDAASLWRIFI